MGMKQRWVLQEPLLLVRHLKPEDPNAAFPSNAAKIGKYKYTSMHGLWKQYQQELIIPFGPHLFAQILGIQQPCAQHISNHTRVHEALGCLWSGPSNVCLHHDSCSYKASQLL